MLQTESSGPGHAVDELLKQSKAFQLTLQDGTTFRTKKDLLENVGLFLENQRDALGALLKKLSSANQARQLGANFLNAVSRPLLQVVR